MTMSMYSSYTPEDFNTEEDIFGLLLNSFPTNSFSTYNHAMSLLFVYISSQPLV